MTDLSANIEHSTLLDIAKVLIPGFKDAEGLCEGINSMLLQAVLTGTTQEKQFYDRLRFISAYLAISGNSVQKLKRDIEQTYESSVKDATLAQKLAPGQIEYRKKLEDILYFINAVVLEHNTAKLDIFSTVRQLDKDSIHSNVASQALEATGKYIHSTRLGFMVSNKKELTDYFDKIANLVNQPEANAATNERAAFVLSSENHTACVYFDQSTSPGKWRFFDVNSLDITQGGNYYRESEMNSEQLASYIFGAFDDDKNNNLNTAFSIRRLSTEGYDLTSMDELEIDPKNQSIRPQPGKLYLSEEGNYLFVDLKKQIQRGTIPSNLGIELSNLKDKIQDFDFRTRILEHISQETNLSLVSKLDQAIYQASLTPLQSNMKTNSRGYDALYFAIESGQMTLVTKLLKEGANIQSEWINEKGAATNPLKLAAQLGQSEIIKILIHFGAHSPTELNNALISSALEGQTHTLITLIEMGAKDFSKIPTNGSLSALLAASINGHNETVTALLEDPDNVTYEDNHLNMAFLQAAKNGHIEVIKVLKNHMKISVALLNKALTFAVQSNQIETFSFLVSLGANTSVKDKENNTLLMMAAQQESATDLISKLITVHKLNVNTLNATGQSALELAALAGKAENAKILIDKMGADLKQVSPKALNMILALSAKEGYVELAKKAIAEKASVNSKDSEGNSALFLATKNNHLDLVKYLLEKGAKINEPNRDGFTPLMIAAYQGNKSMVALLISEEANLKIITREGLHSALSLAARGGHAEVIRLLTDKKLGNLIDLADEDGFTPLMFAAAAGHLEAVQALLDAGANIDAEDAEGNTAVMLATQNNHTEVMRVLQYQQTMNQVFETVFNQNQDLLAKPQASPVHFHFNTINSGSENNKASEQITAKTRVSPKKTGKT